MKNLMNNSEIFNNYDEKDHLYYMIDKIQNMNISNIDELEKSNRWLGWLQALVVEHSELTLDDMKKINIKCVK